MGTVEGTGRGGRATVNDVARVAGVSIATVSKTLNDRGQVRQETRERVRRAAEQLDFVPNPLARGLLEGKTGTVGLLTNDLEGRFSLPILMGAEDAFGADPWLGLRCSDLGRSATVEAKPVVEARTMTPA